MKSAPQHIAPKWLRVLIPAVVILLWLSISAIGGPYFGKISSVVDNNSASFLPASAESTQVQDEIKKFQTSNTIPAIIVFEKDGSQLSPLDSVAILAATKPISEFSGVSAVSPPIQSDDKQAAIVVVNVESSADYKTLVPEMQQKVDDANLNMTAKVTGPLGFLYDLGKAFSGIDGLLLGVALLVVFVILVIVYRSPILPFLVLFTSLTALTAAILAVYYLAKADILTINGQVQGILFILVIGAATDYSLLFVARYKEELLRHRYTYQAIITAWKRSFEPIIAAGGTVIAGLMCLLLSDLFSNKALGPVGSVGLVMAVLAALTLLPSLLLMFGRKVFWPREPHFVHESKQLDIPKTGIWPRTGRFVENHARAIWITTTIVLAIGSLGLIGLRANGIPSSDLILGESQSREGQEILDSHFPGGSGTPTYVIAKKNDMDKAVAIIDKDQGVDSVSVTATGIPTGSLPLGESQSQIPPAFLVLAKPTVVDGDVLLNVTLKDNPDSDAAQATIERLRTDLHELNKSILVGGNTAIQYDTNQASIHDRNVIIPSILLVITIILMILLRSISAAILLLCTTILSFAAALGVSSLVFNHIFNFPGADPSVVLYAFVFLVALGIDYNIFLMTRVREESIHHGTRKGVIIGLIVTGGVITSAGIVLAATFSALAVLPILFLVQLAFVVAFGVLLDTIIVRSLLVPSLVHELGRHTWWPSKIKD